MSDHFFIIFSCCQVTFHLSPGAIEEEVDRLEEEKDVVGSFEGRQGLKKTNRRPDGTPMVKTADIFIIILSPIHSVQQS